MARGRKRKGGERYPSGDRKPVDRGTPEAQSRRAFLAGEGDQTLTWHVLGVLRANGQVDDDEYLVGCKYRNLFGVVYRKPEVIAAPMDGLPKGAMSELDDDDFRECHDRLIQMEKVIDRVCSTEGRRAKDIWDNIVVYDRMPRWMRPVAPRVSDVREAELFLYVLKVLTESRQKDSKPKLRIVA